MPAVPPPPLPAVPPPGLGSAHLWHLPRKAKLTLPHAGLGHGQSPSRVSLGAPGAWAAFPRAWASSSSSFGAEVGSGCAALSALALRPRGSAK